MLSTISKLELSKVYEAGILFECFCQHVALDGLKSHIKIASISKKPYFILYLCSYVIYVQLELQGVENGCPLGHQIQ